MPTLLLEYWTEDDDFYLYAEMGDNERELTLSGQAPEIKKHFKTIYDILEAKKEHKTDELEASIRWLSERVLAPFTAELKACSLVRFCVYDDLIRCAFDLLLFEGSYLFLKRRVCYQIDEGYGEDEPKVELGSALLIADLTADPEEACLAVSKLIPESEYAEVKDAEVKMIRDAASEVDILVVSAHGDLDDDNYGSASINDEEISAKVMGQLEVWVAYFDSCQQGVNLDYLEAFQEESDVQFYLAPIISNDAGDSSTKTMIWFFEATLQHKDPIRALFETRQRLFTYYREKERLNLVVALNKAFAFRLYEFVDSEEE